MTEADQLGARVPLRVLMVAARLNVGGPASQVLTLADGLDPARFSVTVAAGVPDDSEADFVALRSLDVATVTIPDLGRQVHARSDGRALVALDRLVRRTRPDLIHTHTAKAGVLGRLVARFRGVPSVHTFHGHLLHGYFGARGTRAVVATERHLARHTDRIVTVGERVRDDLLAAGIGRPGQYVAMPPGVDPPPPLDRATARQRLGLPDDVPVLGYVGRLTGIKRPDRLLEALRSLPHRGLRPVLVVAGQGDLSAALARRAEADGLDVRFLGWRADVETVYAASDVVVLTSDNEGMPVSLIEAALAGVPAVATDVGSVGEVVVDGETGLLVEPRADAVADGVARLLADPSLRHSMGVAAAAAAARRFAPKVLVRDTAALYTAAVRAGRETRRHG